MDGKGQYVLFLKAQQSQKPDVEKENMFCSSKGEGKG